MKKLILSLLVFFSTPTMAQSISASECLRSIKIDAQPVSQGTTEAGRRLVLLLSGDKLKLQNAEAALDDLHFRGSEEEIYDDLTFESTLVPQSSKGADLISSISLFGPLKQQMADKVAVRGCEIVSAYDVRLRGWMILDRSRRLAGAFKEALEASK